MVYEKTGALPLVVDLDGTLTPTDTLVESIFCFLKKNPFNIFLLLVWLITGGDRALFKHRIAKKAEFSTKNLPWRDDFLLWLKSEHHSGRKIILATAAHESIAHAVSRQLGIFNLVLASNSTVNLKGSAKLNAIREHLGEKFVYAGDSDADLPIWRCASAAILVATSDRITKTVHQMSPVEREFSYPHATLHEWMRALRMHQWVKNILLFVPLFTAFAFTDSQRIINGAFAFFSFSLAASASYLFNDLSDLENDRLHVRKKNRPFASGILSLTQGLTVAVTLEVIAIALAVWTSNAFATMLIGYVFLTTSYSLVLKKYVLIDVMMLAILYTFRILAGSVATNISVTPWLLAFSMFTFFSLALVKRCAELVHLKQTSETGAHGRDYRVDDLVVLWPLGVGASLCSVVVFGLYIGSPSATLRYVDTNALWLVGIGLIYWFSRLWIKTVRGEMHDDPIVFAVRDSGSRVTIVTMVAIVILAHYLG